jgi:hypothetical protein
VCGAVGDDTTPAICCDKATNGLFQSGAGAACNGDYNCCSFHCYWGTPVGRYGQCCSWPGQGCSDDQDCCNGTDQGHTGVMCGTSVNPEPSRCCIKSNVTNITTCTANSQCCGGECTNGNCCIHDQAMSCANDTDCCSNVPHCKTPGAGGQCVQCLADSDCSAGLECTNNACVAKGGVGASCTGGRDCCSTLCQLGKCKANNAVGFPCCTDPDCGVGLECENHVCAALAGPGQPCSLTHHCFSQACKGCSVGGQQILECTQPIICYIDAGTTGLCCSPAGEFCPVPGACLSNAPCCNACNSTTGKCN